jgi:lipopolysaccharide/colanic/teichoic acid biosynthesis glycosyltransferase
MRVIPSLDVVEDGHAGLGLGAESVSPASDHASIGETIGSDLAVKPLNVSIAQRIVEKLIAVIVLTVTAPIMLVLAVIVRRGTPGPALFTQARVGLNGRVFRFVKFRTMYVDAKTRWPKLYAYKYTAEELKSLKFKTLFDPRVTPQGKWMRMSTVDELPNFLNVLMGDMALVGPRPEIPEMLRYYDTPEKRKKFSVRPGITGLAQVSGRGRLSFQKTVKLDLEYVESRSWWLDIKIIVRTAYKMLIRDGAF